MPEAARGKLRCARCDQDLVLTKVELEYMGFSITHELPSCPTCGRIFVSRELAEGRMCELEQTLEDK